MAANAQWNDDIFSKTGDERKESEFTVFRGYL